jgi:hypothetical protein
VALKFKLKKSSGSMKPPAKRALFDKSEDTESSAPKVGTGWMQKGYAGVKKQVALNASRSKGFVPEFWVEDGGEARVRILTEPILLYSHSVMRPGRKVPDQYTCLENTGQVCPLCEAAGPNPKKPPYPRRWMAVYLVIDRRTNEWVDKDGKTQKKKNQLKLWRAGVKVANLLDKYTAKHGDLRQFELDISRVGTSTNTQYMIEVVKDESEPLPAEDKKRRDEFDLMSIIKPKTRSELIARIGGTDGADGGDDHDPDLNA